MSKSCCRVLRVFARFSVHAVKHIMGSKFHEKEQGKYFWKLYENKSKLIHLSILSHGGHLVIIYRTFEYVLKMTNT